MKEGANKQRRRETATKRQDGEKAEAKDLRYLIRERRGQSLAESGVHAAQPARCLIPFHCLIRVCSRNFGRY